MKQRNIILVIIFILLSGRVNRIDSGTGKQAVYVKPSYRF